MFLRGKLGNSILDGKHVIHKDRDEASCWYSGSLGLNECTVAKSSPGDTSGHHFSVHTLIMIGFWTAGSFNVLSVELTCVTFDWGREGTTHQARATVGVTPAGVRRQRLMERLIASTPSRSHLFFGVLSKKLHSCPVTAIPRPHSSDFLEPSPPVSMDIVGSLLAFLLDGGIWFGNIVSIYSIVSIQGMYNLCCS